MVTIREGVTMGLSWNDRRIERRVKPGDGKPLKPFRWWQMTRRSLLSIALPVGGGLSATYTVEVKHGGDPESGVVRARLYRDGLCEAESKLPARFPVPGGTIEVRRSEVGMRRCHFVADDGSETRLVPDPRSAEGRRMNFARQHPGASALIGAVSVVLLLIGVGLNLLQAAQPISEIPAIAESLGTFESPLRLPIWLNVTLGVGAAFGATERAMRMRYHWLLDGGAGT
ncbi:hypothetical protein JHN55_08010 [Streptomyces sp. MBT56]|nr:MULTISPECIES: hypothetical protein [unclassified Streptomyces]MBK3556475.1 hypothetical protein [Streptomyces sp. MBT56]MBK3604984.1 hypothetical protein [Streptomyces sp. MBT54]MBK3617214.1 hypothetical protein [Streptomyces sp. MBT98]